jgi:hypothetical protein
MGRRAVRNTWADEQTRANRQRTYNQVSLNQGVLRDRLCSSRVDGCGADIPENRRVAAAVKAIKRPSGAAGLRISANP